MEQLTTQVVIVGGGPAGAAAAFTLGKLGVPTLLVDRKPRDKMGDKVCGDALGPFYTDATYEMVGLRKPDLADGTKTEDIDDSLLMGKTPDAKIYLANVSATVDRLRYGQALLAEVDKFDSVEIMADARFKGVIVENQTITGITVLHTSGEITIRCRVVIDASGSSGVVRSRLPDFMHDKMPKKIPRHQMIVAYREIIRTQEPHGYQRAMHLVYEPELKMPGYYWIFSRGEQELNIGLGWMIYDENRGTDIREINRIIRERRFPGAEILVAGGDQIPARLPLPSCVHNGFIAAGDAAALANPLNGEGHGPALVSGIKAAQIVAESIEKDDVSEAGLWEYNRFVWHNYGVEFSFGIAVVKFVNRFGFDTFNWLIEKGILQEDDILKIIHDFEAELSLVKRALKGWYRPKILLSLRRVMNQIEKIQEHSKNYPDIGGFEQWRMKLEALEQAKV